MRSGDEVTGVVLAGGRSRRFGADKARHTLGERHMIEHVVDAVAQICSSVIISVGTDSAGYEIPRARSVRDLYRDSGPLAGIQSALIAAKTSWILVAACDMPFLTPASLRTLLDARSALSLQDRAPKAIVATDSAGHLHPLCACYRSDILPAVSSYLDSGRRSIHGLLDRLDIASVLVDDAALTNINTRADLFAAEADSRRGQV